jgi:hypothetical protein
MAGAFALIRKREILDTDVVAARLGDGMALFPWQEPRLLGIPERNAVLGAVIHTDRPGDPEGCVAREGGLACVVEGHLVRTRSDCGAEALIAAGAYARAAMAAYRKLGEDFAAHLEGSFTLLLMDETRGRLYAANGRVASTQLYRHEDVNALVYGTMLGPLAACGAFAPRPDPEGVGHMIGIGQVLGDESVVEGVEALPGGTLAVHDLSTGERRVEPYWTFGDIDPAGTGRTYGQHLKRVTDTLVAASERITRLPGRYVAGLSGGLDSRLVAGLAARHRPDMKTWTFGGEGASDVRVAGLVSDVLGAEHLRFPLSAERVPENAALYATTVDGCCTVDFAHGLDRCLALREQADVVLNGYAGELYLGGAVLGPILKLVKKNLKSLKFSGPDVVNPRLSRNRTAAQVAGYAGMKYATQTRLAAYLTRPPRPPLERVREEIAAMDGVVPMSLRGEYWIHLNRGLRWTMMGIISDRFYFGDASLYYDYDVIEAGLATPHRFREDNRIYIDVIRTLLPELGRVENSNTGFPADTPPGRLLLLRTLDFARRKLRLAPPRTNTAGSDLDAFTRTVCRDFYTGLFRDGRTRGRDLWDGEGLNRLLDDHMAGRIDAGREPGILAAVELFLRQWVDGRRGPEE